MNTLDTKCVIIMIVIIYSNKNSNGIKCSKFSTFYTKCLKNPDNVYFVTVSSKYEVSFGTECVKVETSIKNLILDQKNVGYECVKIFNIFFFVIISRKSFPFRGNIKNLF